MRYNSNIIIYSNIIMEELTAEINNCVNMFNSICKGICSHLLSKFPKNKNIIIYHNVVCDIIVKKPKEVISVFLVNAYSNDAYRESILASNEKFFEQSNLEDITGSDKDNVDVLSQIKACWSQLNKDSKHFIKESMKTLIKICDLYVNKKDDLNNLLKKAH